MYRGNLYGGIVGWGMQVQADMFVCDVAACSSGMKCRGGRKGAVRVGRDRVDERE